MTSSADAVYTGYDDLARSSRVTTSRADSSSASPSSCGLHHHHHHPPLGGGIGGFLSTGDLSDEEVGDLPSCAYATRNNNQITFLLSGWCVTFQQHQLGLRRAAGACAHVPVREAPQQDRHPAPRHRLHRPPAGGAHRRVRPPHLRREVSQGRDQGGREGRVEHQRYVNLIMIKIVPDLTARLSWINWENLGVNPNRRSVLTTLTLTADNMNN
ncbi:hypothetical protein C0J52_00123 [Blattella germanica]|nr:hypothetical protein C0J52_00123 [Blattella germanica]